MLSPVFDCGCGLAVLDGFAFQISCDVSGDTDVDRGIAKCLGLELTLNSNLPYFAKNPREFWTRWHISLSQWRRDSLYIPLGGHRGGNAQMDRNLMLTIFIGGLWHGAAWTFVLWGAYQGAILVGHRLAQPLLDRVKPKDAVDEACSGAVRTVFTFHLVCIGWLIFRATSVAQVTGMLQAIATRFTIPPATTLIPISILYGGLLVIELLQPLTKDAQIVLRAPWYVRSAFYTGCFYAIVLGGEFGGAPFIDFKF